MEKSFWDNRWEQHLTGWDLGAVSPPLKSFFDKLDNKKLKILIPGCGNAYEAEYLWESGFHNTYIVEISELAVESFLKRYPVFPRNHIFIQDFFDLKDEYDLIIEQTFFCAIHPEMRKAYAEKMYALLNTGGKLAGLLFNRDFEGGPPFGGSKDEYEKLFRPLFTIETLITAADSAKPRANTELFFEFIKK
ncbi:MAG: SAM-dependent methyltransferase [Crocinitomicaceae bacterium]|nr:SAM-dependent methyltransferase [Crocinitomicaceae bacterium]